MPSDRPAQTVPSYSARALQCRRWALINRPVSRYERTQVRSNSSRPVINTRFTARINSAIVWGVIGKAGDGAGMAGDGVANAAPLSQVSSPVAGKNSFSCSPEKRGPLFILMGAEDALVVPPSARKNSPGTFRRGNCSPQFRLPPYFSRGEFPISQ